MPCVGYEESKAWSEDTARQQSSRVPELEKQLNFVMQSLCTFTKAVMKRDMKLYTEIIEEEPEIRKLIDSHITIDKERYFKAYSSMYPNFSGNEIYKMVINGILPEV